MLWNIFVIWALSSFNYNYVVQALLPKNAQGVDTFLNVTSDSLTCLTSLDYSYITSRLTNCVNGNVNDMGITTVGNWIQAQFAHTNRPAGLYGIFTPCFCCPNPPETYIKPLFDAIATKMVIGFTTPVLSYLWIAVEPCGSFCNSQNVSPSKMVGMINAVINEAETLRVQSQYRVPVFLTLGIYTSKKYWQTLTGNTNEFSQYQLWYAADKNTYEPARPLANCSDWATTSFGGWSQLSNANFKQYEEEVEICDSVFNLSVCCDCEG